MRLRRRSSAHTEEHTDAPAPGEPGAEEPRGEEVSAPAEAAATEPRPRRHRLRATRLDPATEHGDDQPGEVPPPLPTTAGDVEHPDGDAEHSVEHADEPERATRPAKGRIRALFDEQVAQSRGEAERQAAEELQAFMEPARQQLLLNVPGSSSPEEAEAMLNSQAAGVLASPVPAQADEVVDLRNTSSMGAYPPAAQLSNRVLRLADRHWAKPKVRPSADIVAEKTAIAEQDFARKPAGTQRCLALRGSLRCRGVFAFRGDQQADATVLSCPTCGSAHQWDTDGGEWTLAPESALSAASARVSLTGGS